MAKELLNHYVSGTATWTPGMAQHVESYVERTFAAPSTVRIHETARSGSVLLGGAGQSYGDAEVYLQINFSNPPFKYLSAPLTTDIDFANVTSIRLYLLYVRAIPGSSSTTYTAFVNGHCIYEVL